MTRHMGTVEVVLLEPLFLLSACTPKYTVVDKSGIERKGRRTSGAHCSAFL